MAPGSLVIFKADPLMYGVMLYIGLTKDGLLECESLHERDPDGSFHREPFQALELEEYRRVAEAA